MIPELHPAATTILYVVIFVGALLAFDGLRHLVSRKETDGEARNRRMNMHSKGKSQEETFASLLRETGNAKRGSAFSPRAFPTSLKQAGFTYGVPAFFILCAIVGVSVYSIAEARMDQEPALVIAVVSAIAFPFIYVSTKRRKRQEKLERQLPDALDQMARGLKVGHPLNVTVANVATDMPDPLGTEFGLIEDQITFGDELVAAFDDFADRTGSDDARYLAACVGIQHGTGGNLARVLHVLAQTIRDRKIMSKKISAISAEGRISGTILSILPIALIFIVYTASPEFYTEVWEEPMFKKAAMLCGVLIVLQAFILHRLVNFKF